MWGIKKKEKASILCLIIASRTTNNTYMMRPKAAPVAGSGAAATIKKQRTKAKKPSGLWAFGREAAARSAEQGAYGVWTFPSGAEFVEALLAHANNATHSRKKARS